MFLVEFEDKIGTVVIGTVQRVEPRVVRIELGKAVGIMPQSEQIPPKQLHAQLHVNAAKSLA